MTQYMQFLTTRTPVNAPEQEDEDLFEMANVRPDRSGLPFVVWISQKGGARHDLRVKVSAGPKAGAWRASVSVRPNIEVLEGDLSGEEFGLARAWIELNRDVLIKFWEGEIAYTEDALAALRPIEN